MKKILFPILLFLILCSHTVTRSVYAKTIDEIKREVLVWINKGNIDFPIMQRSPVGLSYVNISSQKLLNAFVKYRVESISRAFSDFTDADSIKTIPNGYVTKIPLFSRIFLLRLMSQSDVDNFIAEIRNYGEIGYAEKNYIEITLFSNDPDYDKQWYLKNTGQWGGTPGADINIEPVWSIFTGNAGQNIGISDVGVDLSHEELNGHATGDWYQSGEEENYHGTLCAGICAASANNNKGIAGVNWHASIISKKANFYDLSMIAGQIIEMSNSSCRVINCSWGTILESSTLREAFIYAYNNWDLCISSMGNSGDNQTNFPAAYKQGVLAVGATDDNDNRTSYSTYGNWISIVAPGGVHSYPNTNEHDIYSTMLNNTYGYHSGTSFSAPLVAGVASLILGYSDTRYLELNPDDIKRILEISASKNPKQYDIFTGWGRLNAANAFQLLQTPNRVNHYSSSGASDVQTTGPYMVNIYTNEYNGTSLLAYRHELQKTVYFPETSNPQVWGNHFGTNGWYFDNILYDIGWCEVVPGSVRNNSAILRTYIYDVWTQNGGHPGWFPFSEPQSAYFTYSVYGPPIVAPVISGFLQSPNYLPIGSYTTITCCLSQGNGTLQYSWIPIHMPSNMDYTVTGTNGNAVRVYYKSTRKDLGSSNSKESSVYHNDSPQDEIFRMQCTVSNSHGSASQSWIVNIQPTGGCPWIAVLDPDTVINLENNILHRSEFSEFIGQDISDKYMLKTIPGIIDDKVSISIYETEHDLNHFDRFKFFAVDHPIGTKIGITEANDIVMYDASTVISTDVATQNGTSFVTDELQYNTYHRDLIGTAGDSTYAHYDTSIVHNANRIVKEKFQSFHSRNSVDSIAFIGQLGNSGDYVRYPVAKDYCGTVNISSIYNDGTLKKFARRENPSDIIIPFSTNGDAVIKASINWNRDYYVGYFSTVDVLYDGYVLTELPLIEATHSNDGNVLNKLIDQDYLYSDLDSLSFINLKFSNIMPPANGYIRDYVFETIGHYDYEALTKGPLSVNKNSSIPGYFKIYQNYPNPFNPIALIKYDLPSDAKVNIKVYDLLGREVKNLVSEFQKAGSYSVQFDGTNLASGVYFYRIEAGKFVDSKKMVLVK